MHLMPFHMLAFYILSDFYYPVLTKMRDLSHNVVPIHLLSRQEECFLPEPSVLLTLAYY